jgi:hypothetical protein
MTTRLHGFRQTLQWNVAGLNKFDGLLVKWCSHETFRKKFNIYNFKRKFIILVWVDVYANNTFILYYSNVDI